jgi:nucleoside-diphosphate-sugar epimerase
MRVVLTGSAGHLGRVLVRHLCAHPDIERVVGIDLRQSGHTHPKFREQVLDIRSPSLSEHLLGVDAVIHAAFVVMRGDLGRKRYDRTLVRDINVNGSLHVFTRARQQGIPWVIHLSSVSVYGAWPDHPARIREEQPYRPMVDFAYGEDKAAVEVWLDQQDWRATRLIRLRPHVILGPHAQPWLRFLLRQPFYPRLPDPQPLTQCVCEEDVADAVLLALFRPVEGSFNLAAEPPLSFREMQRFLHPHPIPAPLALLEHIHRALWHLTGLGGEPGWLKGMRHSLVLDCGRAFRELGWRPRYSARDCLGHLSPV